jgi:hypothetical protein
MLITWSAYNAAPAQSRPSDWFRTTLPAQCRSAGTKIFTELEGTNVNIPSKAPKEEREDGRVVLNKIALVRWPGPRSVWQRLGNHVSPCAWCTAPALHCGLFRAASWRALQPAPRGTPARRLKSGLNFNASIGSARLVHRSCPEPCGCESLKVEAEVLKLVWI